MNADDLFQQSLEWLRQNYRSYCFYMERDIVWTVQRYLMEEITRCRLPLRVFHHFPMIIQGGKKINTDLAIINSLKHIEVAVEFKYEPDHIRKDIDILASKFPVTFWDKDGIGDDVRRIQAFASEGQADIAYSVLIDEHGFYRHREPHPGSEWIDWGNGVWLLFAKAKRLIIV